MVIIVQKDVLILMNIQTAALNNVSTCAAMAIAVVEAAGKFAVNVWKIVLTVYVYNLVFYLKA